MSKVRGAREFARGRVHISAGMQWKNNQRLEKPVYSDSRPEDGRDTSYGAEPWKEHTKKVARELEGVWARSSMAASKSLAGCTVLWHTAGLPCIEGSRYTVS